MDILAYDVGALSDLEPEQKAKAKAPAKKAAAPKAKPTANQQAIPAGHKGACEA